MKTNKTIVWIAGAALLSCAGLAQAQSAGSWLVRAGVTHISPEVSSGDLSAPSFANTKVDVIAGVGKIGEVKALPMTIFAQYRFLEADAKVRPYVGLGLTYAKFFKERGTAALTGLTGGTPANPTLLSAESGFGLTPQIGVNIALNDRWFVDLAYYKTFVKTRNTLSTGQHIDVKLNPNVFTVGVGYRF